MEELVGALIVIVIVVAVVIALIPVAIFCAVSALLGTPAGFIGVLVGWRMSQQKAKIAAEKLIQKNPLGSIVRFGYSDSHESIVWQLDDAKLSNYNTEQEFEMLRWLAAILAGVFTLLVTLFFVSLSGTTWKGVNPSPLNISNWSFFEWASSLIGLVAIIWILKKFLPKQAVNYNQAVKQAAANLINRNLRVFHELSGLYSQAWQATESAAERIGRTGSVTLLASVENNWDALKSENLLSLLHVEDWSKFRAVCDGIRADAVKLDEYALKYLRGEAVPEEDETQQSDVDKSFEILGLPKNSKPDEIKRVYKKLAQVYHPDAQVVQSDEHFKKIQNAYDCLQRELSF